MIDHSFEFIGRQVYAAVNDVHRFGTDALLLADFSLRKKYKNACDLCSGCGILPLLSFAKGFEIPFTALEIDKDACELIEIGTEKSSLTEKIKVVNGDLRNIRQLLPANSYSLVTANPPYYAVGSGKLCDLSEKRPVRSESTCSLYDLSAAASWLLRSGGSFAICHKPERLPDIITEFRKCSLEPKRMRFVQKDSRSKPWLVLVEARLDGHPSLIVEPPLCLDDQAEMTRIYDSYGGR